VHGLRREVARAARGPGSGRRCLSAALLPLLLAAACVRSNRDVAESLERATRESPRADLDAVAEQGYGALPARTPLRPRRLPMLAGDLPLVAGRVNGRPVRVLLDTGSSHVFLTGPAAREARLYVPPAATVDVVAPGADAPHRGGIVESIGFGGLSFGPGLAAFPLVERRRLALGGEHVVAGASVLCHFRVTFDFGAREVRLDPLDAVASPGALTIRAEIDGRPVVLLVDSGAERLALEPRAARRLGLLSAAEARELAPKAEAGARVRRREVRLKRVRVAGRTFRHVAGRVLSTFPDRPGAPDGLLGLAAFGRYAWTLDYGTRRLTVEE